METQNVAAGAAAKVYSANLGAAGDEEAIGQLKCQLRSALDNPNIS